MGAQIAAILMILLQALNKATLPYFYEGLKQKQLR
ncbi:lipopolysaccharide biosynthesis protein [Actinobacillus equuli]|nr:lipopolysaccharide biosynthesis protein [Actinobacillus equuli]